MKSPWEVIDLSIPAWIIVRPFGYPGIWKGLARRRDRLDEPTVFQVEKGHAHG